MSRRTAAALAKKALEIGWDGTLPVSPEKVASKLVVYKNQRKEKFKIKVRGNSALGVSGQASLVTETNEPYFLCEYNSNEVDYRNRFTVAHELAHVVLGHVKDGKSPKRDTSFNSMDFDPDEIEANAFAAELLMPAGEVKRYFKVAKTIEQLANAFGVSTAAMRYRLKNLGLIG